MTRLTIDAVRRALPELEELRPVFDHLVAGSRADPSRAWSGSGALGTVGSRIADVASLSADAEELASREAARLSDLYGLVASAVSALEAGDGAAAARAFLRGFDLAEAADRPDRAAAYALAAFRAVRDDRDQRPAALALRRWARAKRALGHLDDALEAYERSREMAQAMSDHAGAAQASVGAGNVLEDQGHWPEAVEQYRAALDIANRNGEPLPEQWHAPLNVHIALRSQGAIGDSLAWLEEAETAAAEIDPGGAAPYIDNAKGQLSMAEGDFAAAERHLRRAAAAAAGTRASIGFRLNLAETMFAQGRSFDAAELARMAEREAIRGGVTVKLPEVYRLLGRIASSEGESDAFVFFERALEIVRSERLPALEEALTLQAYAEAEAARGDEEAAAELGGEAVALMTELGITHMRQTWADVYGPRSIPPHAGEETEGHDL